MIKSFKESTSRYAAKMAEILNIRCIDMIIVSFCCLDRIWPTFGLHQATSQTTLTDTHLIFAGYLYKVGRESAVWSRVKPHEVLNLSLLPPVSQIQNKMGDRSARGDTGIWGRGAEEKEKKEKEKKEKEKDKKEKIPICVKA